VVVFRAGYRLRYLLGGLALLATGGCTEEDQRDAAGARLKASAAEKNRTVSRRLGLDLAAVKKSGQLVVATVTAPRIYFKWRGKHVGLEHDLLKAYANSLSVDVVFIPVCCVKKALQLAERGYVHIAAARLTRTPLRDRSMLPSVEYYRTRQQLVCHKRLAWLRSVRQLRRLKPERFVLIARSSYAERLRELQKKIPGLAWREAEDVLTEDLLERVWSGRQDCTVADRNIVNVYRRYYPALITPFYLSGEQSIVWYMPAQAKSLQQSVNQWFARPNGRYALKVLYERYYGYLGRFDYLDSRVFIERMHRRLPRYKALFEGAAKKHGLDWRLLAAIGYQESHWDPNAKSPTGVRGLMMLTEATARLLGVDNRVDPAQSIDGGARYFKMLYDQLPVEIVPPDRSWFALAAYNMGMGHLLDAMKLARRLGKKPYRWASVKEVLPLLQIRRYYLKTRYGRARGGEARRYVRNIRNYYDLLTRKSVSLEAMQTRRYQYSR